MTSLPNVLRGNIDRMIVKKMNGNSVVKQLIGGKDSAYEH